MNVERRGSDINRLARSVGESDHQIVLSVFKLSCRARKSDSHIARLGGLDDFVASRWDCASASGDERDCGKKDQGDNNLQLHKNSSVKEIIVLTHNIDGVRELLQSNPCFSDFMTHGRNVYL